MSLSRILNDHPPHPSAQPSLPLSQVFNIPPSQPLISPRPDRSLSPSFTRSQTPTSRQALSSPALDHPSADLALRSGSHHDGGAWDPDTSDWRHSSRPRNGNTGEGSPNSVQEHHYSKNEEPNSVNKKRKRTANDDGDYRPPSSRRVS